MNNPVFAMESGKVLYIDHNSSWTYNSTRDNTAVFVSFSTGSGTSYVALYGHLLRSSVRVQVGDIINAGTKIGEIGCRRSV
jgi:murein DD-endopeptidase MepM/ murein hydrolase activator NlpD